MPAHPVFEQHFAWLTSTPSSLLFQAGGATQNGHLGGHRVNQDALALCSREKTMVGVVCDGCGGSAIGQSNNEVGAGMIAGSAAVLLDEMLQGLTVEELATRIVDFERILCERILLAAGTLFPDPALITALHRYFMTTILAFAMDETNYVVFACGDGIVALNGSFLSLDHNAGAYLAGRLIDYPDDWKARLEKGEGAFRIVTQGSTESLVSLLLATDGFEDLSAEFPQLLKAVLLDAPPTAGRGFDQQLVIDFRARFWHLPELERWAATRDGYDDRSFLLVRRIPPPKPTAEPAMTEPTITEPVIIEATMPTQEAPAPCSKSPTPMSDAAAASSPRSRKRRSRSSRNSLHQEPRGDPATSPKD